MIGDRLYDLYKRFFYIIYTNVLPVWQMYHRPEGKTGTCLANVLQAGREGRDCLANVLQAGRISRDLLAEQCGGIFDTRSQKGCVR